MQASVPVVANVALRTAETALLPHEAKMYARAARLQGGVLPEVFGVFVSKAPTQKEERGEITAAEESGGRATASSRYSWWNTAGRALVS